MPQQFFDRKNIGTILQKMGRECVAQRVHGDVFRNTSRCKPFLQRLIDCLICNTRDIFPPRKEQTFRMIGPEVLPILPQIYRTLLRENRIAVFFPLPPHTKTRICLESMSFTRSVQISDTRSPEPCANANMARCFVFPHRSSNCEISFRDKVSGSVASSFSRGI